MELEQEQEADSLSHRRQGSDLSRRQVSDPPASTPGPESLESVSEVDWGLAVFVTLQILYVYLQGVANIVFVFAGSSLSICICRE